MKHGWEIKKLGEVCDFTSLISNIYQTHEQLNMHAVKSVNICLTLRNFLFGYYIVEYEQKGNDRAKYGEKLLDNIAKELQEKGLTNISRAELIRFRKFYKTYPQICGTLSHKSLQLPEQIRGTVSHELQTTEFMSIEPIKFEFLGLKPKDVVYESDLEQAMMDNMQEFLLEMGNGFCFEARQKKILIDGDYFFIDMVFYHRILQCHVLIEIKVDEFKHEHIGQLNVYLEHYKRNVMTENDNPPVGILLVTNKNNTLVEYATGTMDNTLFVQKYLLELPNKEDLIRIIREEAGYE